ncbi:MAG: serine/threonine-protein kinase [Gemmataceae bacterium]
MPPASSPFLIAAEKCGLFSPDRLSQLLTSTEPADRLAEQLVQSGELTQFQADKLRAGFWQGLCLGSYRVLVPIGRGGMGVVYLAAQGETNAGARYAIKILPPRLARNEPRKRERFYREMRIGSSLAAHRHITRTHEGGEINGVHYLTMEYVPGTTLRKYVQDHGPLDAGFATMIGAGLADGLAHLHAAKVVHRDFKPSNVMLTPGHDAKILDFGFAMVLGESLPADPRIVGGQGYVLGTMDYIAPEQIENAVAVTPASDLYSLGCTLFFALTGSPPYPGGDAQQKLRWHRTSEPPDVRTIMPTVPEELARLVSQLVRRDADRRPQSAAEVRDRLRAISGMEREPVESIDIEQDVEILTHQKVGEDVINKPIFLDDEDDDDESDGSGIIDAVEEKIRRQQGWTDPEAAPLYWYLIAGLVFLIVLFLSALLFIAMRNPA